MSVAINRRTTSSTTPGGTNITKSTTTPTKSRRAYLVVLTKSSLKFIMIAIATRTLVKQFRQVADATTTHSSALRASTSSFKNSSSSSNKVFRRVQVQVIHRHGDRSPITPLQDEAYWQSQLIPETTLTKIAQHTRLKTDNNNSPNTHTAQGRGPFGKLTELGLLQMVQVGSELRDQLVDTADHHHDDDATTILEEHSGHQLQPFLFTRQRPFHPQQHLRVYSTNFPRTIQSVQGLLIGLFPDGVVPGTSSNNNNDHDTATTSSVIEIDVRHTDWMIPDPQPRRTREQVVLEEALARRPHVLERERDWRPLAVRATQALRDQLAVDARQMKFGVGGLEHEHDSIEVEPLSWNQLAEISKCLAVRERLPPGLTLPDVEAILEHAAWRWFQTFQNPRLAHLAMGELARRIVVEGFATTTTSSSNETPPPLTLWSAHDSTLIGLLCTFRLKKPTTWPEYASCLLVELWEDCDTREQFVRFRLNGEILPSQVLASTTTRHGLSEQWLEMIPLPALVEHLQSQEKVTAS